MQYLFSSWRGSNLLHFTLHCYYCSTQSHYDTSDTSSGTNTGGIAKIFFYINFSFITSCMPSDFLFSFECIHALCAVSLQHFINFNKDLIYIWAHPVILLKHCLIVFQISGLGLLITCSSCPNSDLNDFCSLKLTAFPG